MTLADILRQQIAAQQIAVSIREAAALTQLSQSTVKRLVKDGTIVSTKIGTRRLVSVESLRALFS